jgi:formylglycine-generating enzyme required for sulfatase activity
MRVPNTLSPFLLFAWANIPLRKHNGKWWLELNPEPSKFSGDDRPVEQVSWFDVQEFCARLGNFTPRQYRLPSEAEWEYAARASTTSTFHFGETINPDLANYDGRYVYGRGAKGNYREQTTDMGTFPPNVFGLYDMHGNIYEWCIDHYYNNYQRALTDGSAWTAPNAANDAARILRGGCWNYNPQYCRSAVRFSDDPSFRSSSIGFRVVCTARTE